jgi:hypothetical protein
MIDLDRENLFMIFNINPFKDREQTFGYKINSIYK